jgi:hypothetical protein
MSNKNSIAIEDMVGQFSQDHHGKILWLRNYTDKHSGKAPELEGFKLKLDNLDCFVDAWCKGLCLGLKLKEETEAKTETLEDLLT